MAISQKNIKVLWASAAGVCSYPECDEKLCVTEAGDLAPHTIGEMAHIKGERQGSSRFDPYQDSEERNSYQNLILLCPTHHTIIDRLENAPKYTVDYLLKMKSQHEDSISKRLAIPQINRKQDAINAINLLLVMNYTVWQNYGPASDLARKNPHSHSAYAVWHSERLSIIIPNNREICKILKSNEDKFDMNEQKVISLFKVHSRSYERWVNDEIDYKAVVRFPKVFSTLMEESTDVST